MNPLWHNPFIDCKCESLRGLAHLEVLAAATRAHQALVDGWRLERSVLSRFCRDRHHPERWLPDRWALFIPIPVPFLALAILAAWLEKHRDAFLELRLPSSFARWAAQGQLFWQHRVPGSFGG